MDDQLPLEVLVRSIFWANFLALFWRQDPLPPPSAPIGGSDFARWISRDEKRPRDPQQETRTNAVLRRLRKTAIREYECLYRLLCLGDTVEGITAWLNERAARNAIPLPPGRTAHYTTNDTLALIVSGLDFCRAYYWPV